MDIQAIEKLYLDAAEDIRWLLGKDDFLYLAWLDDCGVRYDTGWYRGLPYTEGTELPVPIAIAVAALTEFWRDRLEKAHGILAAVRLPDNPIWVALRTARYGRDVALDAEGNWVVFDASMQYTTFDSLPELIVAAVRALAKEKRDKQKPKPSKAAMRAAQNIQFLASIQNRGPMASDHFSVGRLARIIDKEFANQPQDTKENP